MNRIARLFSSTKGRLGMASLAVQIASFAMLFFAKVHLTAEGFAYLMTQAALAGIIGSVATLRLEVLIYQHFGKMTLAAALVPLATAVTLVLLAHGAIFTLAHLGLIGLNPSIWAGVLSLGLGLSAAQDFLAIQCGRTGLVLTSRATQGVLLGLLAGVLALGDVSLSGVTVLALQGAALLLPVFFWMSMFLINQARKDDIAPAFYIPRFSLIRRSGALSFSVLVNAIYVNLPLLAAAATQTAAFTADFGLILRLLTGPVTLIRQVFGQVFLAQGLAWSVQKDRQATVLERMMARTMLQSFLAYLAAAGLVVVGLYLFRGYARIVHPELALVLFAAVAAQCLINPVSAVRTMIYDEPAFLAIDVGRSLILAAALLLPLGLPFAPVFSVISCVLYLGYYLFIRRRVRAKFSTSGMKSALGKTDENDGP